MTTAKPEKRNLFKELKAEYCQPKTPKLVNTESGLYLAVDGRGGPGGEVFQQCIGALYGMAYTVKFACKDEGRDFVVCKLEALYGIGLSLEDFAALSEDDWVWRMMIRMPEFVTEQHLTAARVALLKKGKEGDFDAVRLDSIEEGRCVQMLHVGPYDEEERTLDVMRTFCAEQKLQPHRWHHEIYLSDPRRVPPEKLKTLLRLPVVAV